MRTHEERPPTQEASGSDGRVALGSRAPQASSDREATSRPGPLASPPLSQPFSGRPKRPPQVHHPTWIIAPCHLCLLRYATPSKMQQSSDLKGLHDLDQRRCVNPRGPCPPILSFGSTTESAFASNPSPAADAPLPLLLLETARGPNLSFKISWYIFPWAKLPLPPFSRTGVSCEHCGSRQEMSKPCVTNPPASPDRRGVAPFPEGQ